MTSATARPLLRRTAPRRLAAVATVATLALSACGGSDGPSTSEQRSKLTDMLVDEASSSGATIDRGCVADAVDTLPADDVAKLVAAGPNGDPDVSTDAQAFGTQLAKCVSALPGGPTDTAAAGGGDTGSSGSVPPVVDAIIAQVVSSVEATGGTVDRGCLEAALSGVDLNELVAKASDPTFLEQFSDCISVPDGATPVVGSIPAASGGQITDQMIETMASVIEAQGGTVDRDCLKAALAGQDVTEIASKMGDPEFFQAYTACFTMGS